MLVFVTPPPFAIAQEERVSLGEEEQEETLADSIVSNVLDDQNVEVVDQDNTAEQDAANVAAQDQDGVQDQDSAQEAANFNVDSDVQVGGQQQREQIPPSPPVPPVPPVPDTTPPTITVPEDVTAEAADQLTSTD